MQLGKRNLPVVVFRTVVETQYSRDLKIPRNLIQSGHGVHAATAKHDDFLFLCIHGFKAAS
jgi:hypothetical protein